MRRVPPILLSLVVAVGVVVPVRGVSATVTAGAVPLARSTTVAPSATRARTVVRGWSSRPAAAASTAPLRVPVTVRTALATERRTIKVQRRGVGKKKWKTIHTGMTSASGAFVATLSAEPGRWRFRLVVKASANARSARTAARTVTVTRLMVAAGRNHTCALRPGGTVRCWGVNSSGQVRSGADLAVIVRPVRVVGITGAILVAAGGDHTCAVLANRTVRCWGSDLYGQLGDGTRKYRSVPVKVRGLSKVTALATGDDHTCAVVRSGRVLCWGGNYAGQLGDRTTTDRHKPVRVPGVSKAVAVTAGATHTCALRRAGSVLCWGNDYSEGDSETSRAVRVPGVAGAIGLADGYDHTCALFRSHTVRCWGQNEGGQLGDGTTRNRPTPVLVRGSGAVGAVSAGEGHTCALVLGGTVRCWGHSRVRPVPIPAVRGVVGVAAGGSHACAQIATGSVVCWGNNLEGELGNGTRTGYSAIPVPVAGLSHAIRLVAGDTHTCAVVPEGQVECWGTLVEDPEGEGFDLLWSEPTTIAGVNDAIALAGGSQHTCAVLAGGSVTCWGDNNSGQLGERSQDTDWFTPSPVIGLAGATAIAAGDWHSCALLAGGSVACWGMGEDGQLGTGARESSERPVTVVGMTGAAAVGAGVGHSCALLDAGTVSCWGDNETGQLGDGTTTDRLTPVPVTGISNAVALTVGDGHSCALLATGTLRCWGANGYGQIGDGTTTARVQPVMVTGIAGVLAVTAGGSQTCAVVAGGRAACWGAWPARDEDDDETNIVRRRPVAVPRLAGATQLALGTDHGCTLGNRGAVACWGSNDHLQLSLDDRWIARRVVGL